MKPYKLNYKNQKYRQLPLLLWQQINWFKFVCVNDSTTNNINIILAGVSFLNVEQFSWRGSWNIWTIFRCKFGLTVFCENDNERVLICKIRKNVLSKDKLLFGWKSIIVLGLFYIPLILFIKLKVKFKQQHIIKEPNCVDIFQSTISPQQQLLNISFKYQFISLNN